MSLLSRAGLDAKSLLKALIASKLAVVVGLAGFFLSWLFLRVLAFSVDSDATLAIYNAGAGAAFVAWVVANVGNALWMPLVLWLYVLRKNRYEWTSAVLVAVATILSMVVVDLLKATFMAPRPPEVAELRDLGIEYRYGEDPTNYAFPSGHTSRAFTLAAVVWGRYVKWRIPFLALAVATGLSMIVIGRHFPSDVLGGAFIGMILGTFTASLARVRSD